MFDTAMDVTPVNGPMMATRFSVKVGRRTLSADVHIPSIPVPDTPPLLALHGISRNAAGIAQAFGTYCEAKGQVLITPRFSKEHWPHFQRIGAYRPDRSLLAMLALVDQMGIARTRKVDLFGYSGGAQLAHRFAMLYPQRVASLHIAAAGWYCLPDFTLPFPIGLAAAEKHLKLNFPALAHNQLRNYLELKLRVYVGAEDHHRDDALRKGPDVDDSQGRNRLARARHYCRTLRTVAEARGIVPDLSLAEIPHCAHSFADCAEAGLTKLVCES